MSKQKDAPQSFAEAIEKLENATHSKVDDFKNILEKDYDEIRKALDALKPHLDGLRDKVQTETLKTKTQVEKRLHEKPWLTLGIVGLIAFVIGWVLGGQRKEEE